MKNINSTLFTEAHKMTKMEISMSQRNVAITIKPTETYRYKFGQWLVFLKTAMTNQLGITSINQSVAYVPILDHDKASYSLSLPLVLNKTVYSSIGTYSEHYHLNKYVTSYIKNNTFLLCLLAIQLLFITLIFTAKF